MWEGLWSGGRGRHWKDLKSVGECLKCFKDINRNLMALEEAASEEFRRMLMETGEKESLLCSGREFSNTTTCSNTESRKCVY